MLLLLEARDIMYEMSIKIDIDLEFIEQQVQKKCFDHVEFMEYVSSVLLLHCAPQQDESVKQISNFAKSSFVDSLKQLYLVLEAIRLDSTNHVLQKLRPLILATNPKFEYENFMNRITKQDKIQIPNTVHWLMKYRNGESTEEWIKYATKQLILNYNLCDGMPETFHLDEHRFKALYGEIESLMTLMSVIMTYKSISNADSKRGNSMKQQISALLACPDTTLLDISLQIERETGKKDMSILNLLEKNLMRDGNVWKVISRKVSNCILNNEFQGLDLVREEIEQVQKRVEMLYEAHMSTYSIFYSNICKNL